MKRNLLHTPEGVRDIYNEECAKKLRLQEALQTVLKQYGYQAIQTPTFEFFDIFGHEIGTIPAKDLYKFFDREGNTLVLRPDITPSIARSVTKYFRDETMPIRLWYQGNVFINNNSYQGKLKESTQLGAELIGDNTIEADGEIIAMLVSLLKAAGLKDFQISIGHSGFFKGLIEAAKLDEETIDSLVALLSNKNFFGMEALIDSLAMEKDLKALFHGLGSLFDTGTSLLPLVNTAAHYPAIKASLERLIGLYEILTYYEIEKYVTIDLGVLSHYHYYTGIIFTGYTFGSGEPIVKGGRYDDLLPYFGKDAASIGFAVVIDTLFLALARQKIEMLLPQAGELIVFHRDKEKEAIYLATRLRNQGQEITLMKRDGSRSNEEYKQYASRMNLANTTFLD